MAALRRYAWLIVGAVVAVLVPLFDVADTATDLLGTLAPLPWHDIGAGILWLFVGAALYFRRSWIGSIRDLARERERHGAAARLLAKILEDGRRSLGVIEDNLAVLSEGDQRPSDAALYLEGARSHAVKVEEVFERVDGVRRRLRPRGPAS